MSYLSPVRDIKSVYLLSDKWQNSPPSTYVNTKVIYLFALNWPLKLLVLFRSAAHNSLTINGCDAVKFCADIYRPQRRTEFGDSVTLAPALRSQFLFGFNILTRFGRIAVKLGEDVQSRCWEDLYWWKVFQGLSWIAVPLYIRYSFLFHTAAGSKRSVPVRRANSWKTPINLEFIK